ncbi:MAG: hypothetical protein Fur0024_5620 [Patescibacteria group bacterium]
MILSKILSKKVYSNALIHLVGRIVGVALVLLTARVVASGLGAGGSGEYEIPKVYLWTFATILDFGIYLILVRMMSTAKTQNERENIFGNFLGFRIFSGSLVYIFALFLMIFTPYNSHVKWSILILIFGQLSGDVNQVLSANFQVDFKLWKLVFGETVGRLVELILTIIGINLNWSLEVLIFIVALGDIVTLAISWFFVCQEMKIKIVFDFASWKKFLIEAFPLGVAMMFTLAYFRIDSVILSFLKSEEDVGIYRPAFRIVEFTGIIPQILMGTFFPILATGSKDSAIKLAKKVSVLMTILAIVGVLFTFLISPYVINIYTGSDKSFLVKQSFEIFGKSFVATGSITALNLLIVSAIFSFPTSVLNYLLVSKEKQKLLIFPAFVGVLTSIILNIFLIPKFSYIGTSIVTCIVTFIVLILTIFQFRKYQSEKI